MGTRAGHVTRANLGTLLRYGKEVLVCPFIFPARGASLALLTSGLAEADTHVGDIRRLSE